MTEKQNDSILQYVNSSPENRIKCITDGFSKFSKEELWKHCLKDHLGQYYQLYQEHESLPSKMDAEIIKDVTRTYPLDSLFQTASNQMKMFHITRMYCLIDPCVGYCQGMCFPVGAFLKFFDEKLAFGCVMHIFKELKMRHFFQVEKFTLTEVSARMTEAIESRLPEVYKQIKDCHYDLKVLIIPWTVSMTGTFFSLTGVQDVLDLVLLFGPTAIFNLLLALMHVFQQDIVGLSSSGEFHSFFRYRLCELYLQNKGAILLKFCEITQLDLFSSIMANLEVLGECRTPESKSKNRINLVNINALDDSVLSKINDSLAGLALTLLSENDKLKSQLFLMPDAKFSGKSSDLGLMKPCTPLNHSNDAQKANDAVKSHTDCNICKVKEMDLKNKISQMNTYFDQLAKSSKYTKEILMTLKLTQTKEDMKKSMNPYRLYEELLDSSASEAKAQVKVILLEDELMKIECDHLHQLKKNRENSLSQENS